MQGQRRNIVRNKENKKRERVTSAIRRDWLRRYEEGETPVDIAKSAGFDPRTVRKQITLAQEQLELVDARAHVLRTALERHYEDLCRLANEIKSAFFLPTSFGSTPGDFMDYHEQDPLLDALQEHLPRSPFWKHIKTWGEAKEAYNISVEALKGHIWQEVTASSSFPEITIELNKDRFREAVLDDFGFHLLAILRGEKGLGSRGEDKEVAGIRFRQVDLLNLAEEKQVWLRDLLVGAQMWDEFHAFTQATEHLVQTRKAISAELDTIILRRVLPGRCRYCPF